MPSKQKMAEVEEVVSPDLTLLQGFRDLVAERYGYWLGARVKRKEMTDATTDERKVANGINKTIKTSIPQWIQDANIDAYNTHIANLKEARATLSEKAKPFREKISPLAKAVRFMDNVAIPDALKELGTPIQPLFSISEYIESAMKA